MMTWMQTTYLNREYELLIWQEVLKHKMIHNFELLEKSTINRIKSELPHNKMIFHYKIIQIEIKTCYQMNQTYTLLE